MSTAGAPKLRVFLCHASEDKLDVRNLCDKLSGEGWIEPWLDEKNILPGQEWDMEIEKAVEAADVVIVFLSNLSLNKEGYIQREMKFALDIALEKPEGIIFIIPLRLDDCKPQRLLRTWQYVDYFPEDQRNYKYQLLLQSLRLRLEQKHAAEEIKKAARQSREKEPAKGGRFELASPPSVPQKLTVVPTGLQVALQNWTGTSLPSGYAFVGEMGVPSAPHFFRNRDGHTAVLVSDATMLGETFLIDKYAITCRQYCDFLNELGVKGAVQTTTRNGEYQAVAERHILAVDAIARWKKPLSSQPWLHAPKPFGITYHGDHWAPVPESDLLPATLITWWGARLYSLWAHDELGGTRPEAHACLPTPEQWQSAATWDPATQSHRRYPWGDTWNPLIVNFSGYWAGCKITEADWQSKWAGNSLVYSSTHPLPVADLEQNISPVGCVQMLGNTWEWTLSTLESRLPVRGGCAMSPMEHCQARGESRWAVDMPYEYIGFRCAYPIRRSA